MVSCTQTETRLIHIKYFYLDINIDINLLDVLISDLKSNTLKRFLKGSLATKQKKSYEGPHIPGESRSGR